MIDGLRRALRLVSHVLSWLSAALILGLMALIGAEIVARAALNLPFRGTAELASIAIVAIVFMGLPRVADAGRMIRSDLLLQMLSKSAPGLARLLDRGFDGVAAVFFATVAWAVWPKLARAVNEASFIGNAGDFTFPLWPKLAAIVIGAALAAVILILRALVPEAEPESEQATA